LSLLYVDGKPQIEQFFKYTLPDVGVPVLGYIDMVDAQYVPCDIKVSGWNAAVASDYAGSGQALVYLHALRLQGNSTSYFRHIALSGKPSANVFTQQRFDYEIAWMLDMIRRVWLGIKAGAFPPNYTNKWCSANNCEYWDMCRGKKVW
jgi:hypothetical protein